MKKILVLAGLSAAGKTTVMTEILTQSYEFEYIRSATTRAPRGDGRDSEYSYLSKDEFLSRIERGEMLEYTEFGENLYGTPAFEIERILKSDKIPVLILDINGVISLKNSRYSDIVHAVWLFDDEDVLKARLKERISLSETREEGERIFSSRIRENKKDSERVKTLSGVFDILIKNESVSESANKIRKSLLVQ